MLVAPPGGAQPAAPAAVISGPHVAVAGTAVGFSARATVPGGVITGCALAATTQAGAGSGPAVFYFNAAGQLSQTDGPGTSWVTSTLSSGPRTSAAGSLALADTNAGVGAFYLGGPETLTVAANSGHGWGVTSISARYGVAAGTPLSAITTGPDQVSVFFVDQQGEIAEATGSMGPGRTWTISELPGTSAATSLAAVSDLLPSGSPGQEVFWLSRAGQPAVTAWNGRRWQTTTLPGAAASIAGVSAYPVAGAAQEVFLADGGALRLAASPAPGARAAGDGPGLLRHARRAPGRPDHAAGPGRRDTRVRGRGLAGASTRVRSG